MAPSERQVRHNNRPVWPQTASRMQFPFPVHLWAVVSGSRRDWRASRKGLHRSGYRLGTAAAADTPISLLAASVWLVLGSRSRAPQFGHDRGSVRGTWKRVKS